MPSSPLGSAGIGIEPQLIQITETTCFQLSLFKDIMKEYRKLDDGITMRLNRNNAQWRDKERMSGKTSTSQDAACEAFWRELVANWKGRKSVIDFCVGVVDAAVDEKAQALDPALTPEQAERSRLQARMTTYEVTRRQIRQEVVVEAIVRRRSWEAFTSRCKHFVPPRNDAEARKWWDAAMSGRPID